MEQDTDQTDMNPDDSRIETDSKANANPESESHDEPKVDPGFRPFKIDIDYWDKVCYALAYNKVPTVKSLTVTNVAGGMSGDLSISVEIRWSVSDVFPMKLRVERVEMPMVGASITLNGDDFRLDDTALVNLDEEANARLIVTASDDRGVSQTEEREIRVFSRNQWLGADSIRSVTAAFVQPNHPAVTEILSDASSILRDNTGDSALQGYQGGPERAFQIGQGLFYALQRRVDNYINPPASFAQEGQKLRPIDEVLSQRQGTCFDLACAYASCLEQAGLFPFVFLVHGHAFTAFATEARLVQILDDVTNDFSTIVTAVESGQLVAVETTLLAEDLPFTAAVDATRKHLRESVFGCPHCEISLRDGQDARENPHLESLVNVARCHRNGILPIPARVTTNGVVTIVIDNGPSQPPVIERRDSETRKLLPNTVPARVQQWKNSLLDLSMRNPLLNHRPDRTGVSLVPPTGLLGEVEDFLSAGHPLSILPADSVGEIMQQRGIRAVQQMAENDIAQLWRQAHAIFGANESGPFSTRFKSLVSRGRSDEQEMGVNNLYMTFGSLRWSDPKSAAGDVTSPIFMTPIRVVMKRGNPIPTIVIDDTGSTTINFCLVEALRSRRGLKLQWFADDMSDDHGLDIQKGLQELRKEILEQRLTDHGVEVVEDMSIGLLRFGNIRLWKDLNDHWEMFQKNPIVSHMIDGGRGKIFNDPNDPDHLGCPSVVDSDLTNPQPADGAQSRAIKRALAGQSFVLEGPPGTGKSQTITNLLANALAAGRKVLFVAEKQPALQVVAERLKQVGLDPFCLELHDKGSSPDHIKDQLRSALDFVPNADLARWDELNRKFDNAAKVLSAYREKVHGSNTNGASYHDAYARLLELGNGQTADVTRKLFDVPSAKVAEWRTMLGEIEPYALNAKPRAEHPWSLIGPVRFDEIDRSALSSAITALQSALTTFGSSQEGWAGVLGAATTVEQIQGVLSVMDVSSQGASPKPEEWRDVVAGGWLDAVEAALKAVESNLLANSDLVNALGTSFLYEDHTAMLAAVTAASESFVVGRKGKVSKSLGSFGSSPLFADGDPETAVRIVTRMKALSGAHREALARLSSVRGLVLPLEWDPFSPDAFTAVQARSKAVATAGEFLATGSDLANRALQAGSGVFPPSAEMTAMARNLVAAVAYVRESLRVSDESWITWLAGRSDLGALRASVSQWSEDVDNGTFRSLQRWIQFAEQVSRLDDDSVTPFRRQLLTGEISGEAALGAFDRALMSVTMRVVGEENDLDVFDHTIHNRRVAEFIELMRERESALRAVIPHMLHAGRTFNARAGAGDVGQLRIELNSKKRGARSVRGLISRYPDLITSLTPCFMMSPDSIAKFLEPGKVKFDLVVFDEASQITVASAVGALGRASSAVVVGDSRQMPPTMVGVALSGTEDDEVASRPDAAEEAVITDAESILDECLDSGLEQEWLAWHYRSQDELLIKFSNEKYYDGRLSSFPSPYSKVPGCGIEYHRVNGQFDHGGKRTNPIEADAIVAEVRRRANDPILRNQSIGVITLNKEQQDLVKQKLGATNDPRILDLLESTDEREEYLFVLNLESVQGRERDVIILGTGFSGRVGGGTMPLNFGPLTTAGGERRLNVAVTRARRQMVVFSSFDPQELERATSLGMQHLKEYLAMAKATSEGVRPDSNVPSPASDDMHRDAVAGALRDRGLIVRTGLGLSSFKVDLAVTLPGHEDKWLVGVLLDGKVWASRELVLDRDALPTNVLQRVMGWRRIVRVWLPSWRSGPKEIVEDIYDAAVVASSEPEHIPEPIVVQPVEPAPPAPAASAPTLSSAATDDVPLEGERSFEEPSLPGQVGARAELEALSPRARELFAQITERYGPLPLAKAIRYTASCFDLSKVLDKKIPVLAGLADPSCIVDTEFGPFVFPQAELLGGVVAPSFVWFRRSTFSQRKVSDIAPHELANLFVAIVRNGYSMEHDELINETMRFLGYGRKGADTVDFVSRVIEWAVTEEYLEETDGRLVVGPKRISG